MPSQHDFQDDEIEDIISFKSLVSSSYIENGFMHIFYQCPEDMENVTLHYCLRVAIKKLGYKIVRKENYGERMVTYVTNIPESISEQYMRIWNSFCDQSIVEFH